MAGILLCSGGVDSVVLAYDLAQKGQLVSLCLANFGQATIEVQRNLVRHHARRLSLPWHELPVALPQQSYRKEIMRPGFKPPDKGMMRLWEQRSEDEQVRYLKDEFIWIDGRNAYIFLTAAVYAGSIGCDTVYTAFQYDRHVWANIDAYNSGDMSPRFVAVMNDLLQLTLLPSVAIKAPFFSWRSSKQAIIRRGRRLGADLTKTYSCEFYPACGRCYSCLLLPTLGVHQSSV